MKDVAARIARAHADTTDLALADDWAVVSGVPCQHIALPYPWATTGRFLALPGPAAAGAVAEVAAWLRARSPHWSLLVLLADEPAFAGFQRWELMPVLALRGQPRSRPGPPVQIGPACNPDEFLVPYGAEHAPQVTEAHLAAQRIHHLVARMDGEPVGVAALLGCITRALRAARVPARRRPCPARTASPTPRLTLAWIKWRSRWAWRVPPITVVVPFARALLSFGARHEH